MDGLTYTVCDTVKVSGNGEALIEEGRMHGETVDRDWVERYMAIDTRRFFINLGGLEEYRKTKDGTLVCRSTSPDGSTVRTMKFKPVKVTS